jgi:hypothetical protein
MSTEITTHAPSSIAAESALSFNGRDVPLHRGESVYSQKPEQSKPRSPRTTVYASPHTSPDKTELFNFTFPCILGRGEALIFAGLMNSVFSVIPQYLRVYRTEPKTLFHIISKSLVLQDVLHDASLSSMHWKSYMQSRKQINSNGHWESLAMPFDMKMSAETLQSMVNKTRIPVASYYDFMAKCV